MPLFSQSCLENIRQRVSIVDVVSPYVQLKPSGHYLKGLSPFSHEKTPSFFVDPQKNIFKCFSSGYAGDIFRFLELKEQLSFSESVEWLCERFNIPIEYDTKSPQAKPSIFSAKKLLFSIYEKSMLFFREHFWANNETAERTRNYWTNERHFSIETARAFNVGFAPVDPSFLYKFLIKSGFSHDALCESGLFYKPKFNQDSLISRWQGRLILPICDIQDRTIAFSGRQLPFLQLTNDPTRDAKYINSPETLIFVKGKELFNLAKARQNISKDNPYIYLVEGPLDVIRCWECGLKTTLAPQGTGLTEDQLKILKRYDATIIGMFDGDSAGIKAGIRLMNIGIPLELSIKYYLLNPEEDPDSAFFIHPERCQKVANEALDPVNFFIRITQNLNLSPEEAHRPVLQFMLPIIQHCESSVLRFELLQALSRAFGFPPNILKEELSRLDSKSTELSASPIETSSNHKHDPYTRTLEGQLLMFLLHAPQWTSQILKTINFDWIETSHAAGQLLMKMLNRFNKNGIEPLEDRTLWQLTNEEEGIWCQLLTEDFEKENEVTNLELILQQMYRRYLKNLISAIDKELIKSSNINAELFKKLQMDRFLYKKALADVSSSICLERQ